MEIDYSKIARELMRNGGSMYVTSEERAEKIIEGCKGEYNIEILPEEEVPKKFRGRIGLRFNKLEKISN